MKFTKAEISEDGKVVHLVHDADGNPEHYYLSWFGGGRLNNISHYDIHQVTDRFKVPEPK